MFVSACIGYHGYDAELFVVARYVGSVRKLCDRVVEALLELEGDFVCWPRTTTKKAISESIQASTGFPKCLGFVDRTTFN